MEGLFMQAPPILGGDRADATGADLLRQLRAEASGASSAADALGRLGGARRFARIADLLHTALDGSTTPESFANIVAARARETARDAREVHHPELHAERCVSARVETGVRAGGGSRTLRTRLIVARRQAFN